MAKRVAFIVHGKVQGVFFRDFAQQKANAYGLTGFVTNKSDGTVQGEAQGDAQALERLTKDLKEGPKAAHVVRLEVKDIDSKDGEASFSS